MSHHACQGPDRRVWAASDQAVGASASLASERLFLRQCLRRERQPEGLVVEPRGLHGPGMGIGRQRRNRPAGPGPGAYSPGVSLTPLMGAADGEP